MPRLIDVVTHRNVLEDELVYREPQVGDADFRMGSQVIVQENQVAVFVSKGQATDVLEAGAHTLNTNNIPILAELIGLVTSGRTPFTAEVYFINLKRMPAVRWGTNPPIVMETPGRGPGFMLLQTFGVVELAVEDPVMFLKTYGMGRPILRLTDIQDRIQTMLLGQLGKLMANQQITGIQAANKLLDELENSAESMLAEEFRAMGMGIYSFKANPFQAKDVTGEDIVKYGGDISTYERAKRLDVAQAAAENPGTAGTLAGAGVGLGVGSALGSQLDPNQAALQAQIQQQQAMIQQLMAQMAQNQQNQGAGAPQNPTTKAEVQALLDNLDMQLAKGQISEATHSRLVAKWEARLKELGG